MSRGERQNLVKLKQELDLTLAAIEFARRRRRTVLKQTKAAEDELQRILAARRRLTATTVKTEETMRRIGDKVGLWR